MTPAVPESSAAPFRLPYPYEPPWAIDLLPLVGLLGLLISLCLVAFHVGFHDAMLLPVATLAFLTTTLVVRRLRVSTVVFHADHFVLRSGLWHRTTAHPYGALVSASHDDRELRLTLSAEPRQPIRIALRPHFHRFPDETVAWLLGRMAAVFA